MENKVDLSISIVNTSNWTYLKPCIESIIKNVTSFTYEILVVDNYSTDESPAKIKQNFPNVILTENTTRYGFAKNNNINIKKSSGRYILLLNDDTLILPNTLNHAINVLDMNPDIGIVGCNMIYPDGKYQTASARKLRTLLSEFIIETGLFRIWPQIYIEPKSELTDVDLTSEAGMMIRREVLETVGHLDEQFFMYGEGADFCRRVKESKWRIVLDRKCSIVHFGGTTNNRVNLKMLIQFYKSTYLYFYKASKIKGVVYRFMILILFYLKKLLLFFGSIFIPRIKQKYDDMKVYYDSIIDLMANRVLDRSYPFPVE